jgi:hypothetical protein
MSIVNKKLRIKQLENSLRLEIAILKYDIIEGLLSGVPRSALILFQEKLIIKEYEYKNVMLGNYNKLHYSI